MSSTVYTWCSRRYRDTVDETPTYTGGISREARDRQEARYRRDKEKRIYSSSKEKSDNRDDDKDRKGRGTGLPITY